MMSWDRQSTHSSDPNYNNFIGQSLPFQAVSIPIYEDVLQAGVDEIGHQGAVVSADSLYALAVHLIMCVRTGGEIEACIALLIDQQVGVVHLRSRPTTILYSTRTKVCICSICKINTFLE